MSETKQQALASFFGEAARLVRAHPDLYDTQALERIGVLAGLSLRLTRLVALNAPSTYELVKELAPALLVGLARISGVRGRGLGLSLGYDRRSLLLLAALRRAYLRALEDNASRGAAGVRPSVVTSCPRCGDLAERDLAAPAPCAACGFVFEDVSEAR